MKDLFVSCLLLLIPTIWSCTVSVLLFLLYKWIIGFLFTDSNIFSAFWHLYFLFFPVSAVPPNWRNLVARQKTILQGPEFAKCLGKALNFLPFHFLSFSLFLSFFVVAFRHIFEIAVKQFFRFLIDIRKHKNGISREFIVPIIN